MDRGLIEQEIRAAETGVPFTALGVEDPERGSFPRRPVSVAGDQGLRALAHDVPAQADPGAPREFQAQTGGLGDGGGQAVGGTGRLEDDEDRVRATGERRQPTEPIGDPGRTVRGRQPTARQVQEEQVHRAPGQQAAGDRQPLIQAGWGDDHEPLEVYAAGDRLHRVERAGEVQPGHHRAPCLGFGGDS